jgi:hypothetical protein
MKSLTLQNMKSQLKSLAETIRTGRREHKARCYQERYEFRHLHLVYGLLRGRTIEQMESKVREGNKRNQRTLDRLLQEHGDKLAAERGAWEAQQPAAI